MTASIWSDPIRSKICPMDLDLNFERPSDKQYPFRINRPDQYMLVPAIGIYAPFILPIPLGFRTDGPSIPWFCTWLIRKDGPVWIPAIPHDVACAMEMFGRDVDPVNQIMRIAMEQAPAEIPAWQQKAVFRAVDKFCWMTYRDHKADEVSRDRALVLAASKRLQETHPHLYLDHAPIEEVVPAYSLAA